ncbi:NUDIX hydrolase domain-like protein [Xylogone sp. PMI_703]|nr:NUDIX hydrolase domain-like protein [Xylogone sp. PMI_703]
MNVEDMLSRKFGKEVTNYFAGLPLNRVGFLRTDHTFLNSAVQYPSTSFLLFNNLAPLTESPSKLVFVSYKDVEPLIGNNPFKKSEEILLAEYDSTITRPLLILLGLDEKVENSFVYKKHKGAPYFALDVTPIGTVREQANKVISAVESKGLKFFQGRSHMKFSLQEGAIFSMARAFIDWNARNPYCSQCGQSTVSVHAGGKRACPPADRASAQPRLPCTTRTTVSNISFCRTDPSIIVAVISSDGKRTLLGHNGRWQPHWYSTLAGFCEPGESAEEATRREVWEETGVRIGRVIIHSTQPWPYPSSLMIGAIAQALPDHEEILLDNDAELADARWFDLQEVSESLDSWTNPMFEPPPPNYIEGKLMLPPSTTVAHQILRAIVGGYLA